MIPYPLITSLPAADYGNVAQSAMSHVQSMFFVIFYNSVSIFEPIFCTDDWNFNVNEGVSYLFLVLC